MEIHASDFSADEAIAAVKAFDYIGDIGKYMIRAMFVDDYQIKEKLISDCIKYYNNNQMNDQAVLDFWWDDRFI